MLRHAMVRVPASTSNLGAGFDTLGLAVRRYLTARFEPGEGELVLHREGTLNELNVPDDQDLLARAFAGELRRRGSGPASGTVHVTSEIPIGRGLGTSAAATIAGLMLAASAAGDPAPDLDRLLDEAAATEGHGDNAGPALYGGLVGVIPRAHGGFRALPFKLSFEVAFAFAAPSARISTAEARRALPAQYPKETAVAALGRLTALLHGLAEGDGDALAVGLADEIHVPYRLPLIQGGAEVMDAARQAGAWGATISGSGSGMIALCSPGHVPQVESAMAAAFRHAGHDEVVTFPLEPERAGARSMTAGQMPGAGGAA